MARTIELKSRRQQVNNNGDVLQLVVTLQSPSDTGAETHKMEEDKDIRVSDWGELEWSYDFEDALLVPGTYNFTLEDGDSYLYQLLFGPAYAQYQKNAEVRVLLNDATEYVGTLQEDAIRFDRGSRRAKLTVDPFSIKLNQQQLYNADGSAVNPFNFKYQHYYSVQHLLEKMYGLVSPLISVGAGSLSIYHDWNFYATLQNPNSPYNLWELWDGKFTELFQLVDPLFFMSEYGLVTVGDVLKKLAMDWCCFTGLIHRDKAFFKKLFCYDPTNTQSLDVLNTIATYQYQTIDYVKVDAQGIIYERGVNTHLEGRDIQRKSLPAFVRSKAFTNVKAGVARGLGQDGYYNVYGVIDAGQLFKGQAVDSGKMQAEFWYNFRHNLDKCRVDEFQARGITYSFIKDFQYDGAMYQPISLKKQLAKNRSVFQALHLGRV